MSDEGTLKTSTVHIVVYRQIGGPTSKLLERVFAADPGSYLLVGEPVTMSCDHRDQQVVPLLNVPPGHFILLSDAEAATIVPEEERT